MNLDPKYAVRNLKVSLNGIVTFDLPITGAPHGIGLRALNEKQKVVLLPKQYQTATGAGPQVLDLNNLEMNPEEPFFAGEKLLISVETLGPNAGSAVTVAGEELYQFTAPVELVMNCSTAYLYGQIKKLDTRTAGFKSMPSKDVVSLLQEINEFKALLAKSNISFGTLPSQFVKMNSLLIDFDKRVEKIVATQVAAAIKNLPPNPPVTGKPHAHAAAPGNQPQGCLSWSSICKFGLCALLAIALLLLACCLFSRSSSENVNVWSIGWGNWNWVNVSPKTVVTNIIVPAPEPSACERAREERRLEALTEATRNLDRWQHNQFLLDEKRRKEQEQAEQVQPAPTVVNVYTTQAAPAPAQIVNQINVQSSDIGYSEVRNYPPPVYIDQGQRDCNAMVSARINAGVELNVGFGNGGCCYPPPVVHFIPRKHCW